MSRGLFSTRSLVFAALTVAAMQIWTMPAIALTLPAELSLGVVGLSSMAVAPGCSFLLAIALARLQKRGALLLVTGLYAAVAAMGPGVYIALFILIGGVVAETVCTLVWGGYRTAGPIVTGPVIYHLAMFPATLLLRYLGILNNPLGTLAPWMYGAAFCAVGLLALAGSLAGWRVAQELIRAGKLRRDEPPTLPAAEPAP